MFGARKWESVLECHISPSSTKNIIYDNFLIDCNSLGDDQLPAQKLQAWEEHGAPSGAQISESSVPRMSILSNHD